MVLDINNAPVPRSVRLSPSPKPITERKTANSRANHLFRHLFVDIPIRNKRHIRLCYS